MKVRIEPQPLKNQIIHLPPSKSLAHRALICASLTEGTSIIEGVDFSEDIQATIDGLKKLGVGFKEIQGALEVTGVTKCQSRTEIKSIDCCESGSTLRFLIPIFAQTGEKVRFTGKKRLFERPLEIYKDLFNNQGLKFEEIGDNQIEIQGPLQGGDLFLSGDKSSQFISGLCFILPLLEKDTRVIIENSFESQSYVDLTIEMLNLFGIQIQREGNEIRVQGGQQYKPTKLKLEADYSQFAFFAVLGMFHGPLDCLGLSHQSKQGDKAIVDILKKMGGNIEEIPQGYRIFPSKLKGTEVSLKDCPDLGPILSVVGSLSKGKMILKESQRLRLKESDRIQSMEEELKKCNILTESTKDTMIIYGDKGWRVANQLESHGDHRIAMALVIGGLCCNEPIVLNQAESVKKSYPSFYEDLQKLGIEVAIEEGVL